jgi:tetraacyldisaccharide-1-P 4'-kinase
MLAVTLLWGNKNSSQNKVSVREATAWKEKSMSVHMCSGLAEPWGVASSSHRNISHLAAAHSFPRHKPHSETEYDEEKSRVL